MMKDAIDIAAALCVGSASLIYLGGYIAKRKAENLKSAIRVNDLKGLAELLENKTKPLIVALSGTVGSATPFRCEHLGTWGVFLKEKVKLASSEMLLKHKVVPWFLEDSSSGPRVYVVSAQYAEGFKDNVKKYMFDVPESELFKRVVKPEGFDKMRKHTCCGDFLEIGTPLTIVGEAVKYDNGAILIKRSMEEGGSFMVFDGFKSLDKMISYLESCSKTLVNVSIGLAAIGALVWAIPLVIKAWRAYKSHTLVGKKAKPKTGQEHMGKAQRVTKSLKVIGRNFDDVCG